MAFIFNAFQKSMLLASLYKCFIEVFSSYQSAQFIRRKSKTNCILKYFCGLQEKQKQTLFNVF